MRCKIASQYDVCFNIHLYFREPIPLGSGAVTLQESGPGVRQFSYGG